MELFYKTTTSIPNRKGDYRPRGHQYSWSGRHNEKWKSFCPRSIEKQRLGSHKKGKNSRAAQKRNDRRGSSRILKKLLLKILNDAHVPQEITPTKFGGIINNITISQHLSFFEKEDPTERKTHNQPLHIAVKCGNYMIARVLIDNGSSLNLYAPSAILKNNPVVVKAFNGFKREVMGEITLLICIGRTIFDIIFQDDLGFMLREQFLHPCIKSSNS
ncbi:hypothetical protein CR513_47374, partial [Mucuna pruriens]